MGKQIIFSFTGGGVRGVIEAAELAELERQTGQLTRDVVSFVAGTSTGALIAAAVAAGIPATQIVSVYRYRTSEVFRSLPEPLGSIQQIAVGYKYDNSTIDRVVRSALGAVHASEWTMNDCPLPILITAKGIDLKPWYFVRDTPLNSQFTGKTKLADAAVGSSCAPTYFDARVVNGVPLYDGGVGVTGNPVYQACVEAFLYTPGFAPENALVFDFGTGSVQPIAPAVPQNAIEVLQWTIAALLDGPDELAPQLVERHWPGILTRIDTPLPRAIDMADVSAVPEMLALAQQSAAQRDWKALLSR